ncbi:MAG TPA: DUF4403 family protein [Puia sp.]|nr:DUF4403 family protein [Puia sp.]
MATKYSFIVIAAMLLLSSCFTVKPAFPKPPVDSIPNTPPPASKIAVPVTADLSGAFAGVNNMLGAQFPVGASQGGKCDPNYNITLDKTGPFSIALVGHPASNSSLELANTMTFSASASVCLSCPFGWGCVIRPGVSCGPCRFYFSLGSPLVIRPDYHVVPNIQLENLYLIDPCKVTFLNIDISGPIVDAARGKITPLLGNLNAQVANLPLVHDYAQNGWNTLSEKFQVSTGLYLKLHPSGLAKDLITGAGNVLTTNLGLVANPELTSDASDPTITPLPPLGESVGFSGFNIYLDLTVDYGYLNSLLNSYLKGQTFTDSSVHQSITIKKATLFPTTFRRVVIKVCFKGDQRGWVYLIGKPTYDAANRVIRFSELDYDLGTKNVLVDALAWLAKPFLLNYLQGKAAFGIGQYIDPQVTKVNGILGTYNNGTVNLAGSALNSVNIVDNNFQFLSSGLYIRAHASGNLNVALKF